MENNKDLEFRKIFGERLKRLREETRDTKDKKMTLEKFASEMSKIYDIDMSGVAYANYERGFRIPDLFILSKIAEYFDVSTDYLLGITDMKNAQVLQTSVFDNKGVEHTVRIGIDKNSDLSKMTIEEIKEIRELVDKLKELGINMDKK